jgi:prepilin-type N-terminal cleavage/methylation domain-containing protein
MSNTVAYKKYKGNSAGYTLVEMAITVSIIGILIGITMLTQQYMQAARFRSVISDLDMFQSAIANFSQQYGALPGDFNNGSGIWGTSCASTVSNCNGNGNGFIDHSTVSAQNNEMCRGWQHLKLAGMLSINVNGVCVGTGAQADSTNAPASKLGGGYSIGSWSSPATFSYTGATNITRNFISLGDWATNSHASGALLNGAEAYNIDVKIDDGLPGNGSLISSSAGTCSSGTTYNTASYRTTSSSKICTLYYLIP